MTLADSVFQQFKFLLDKSSAPVSSGETDEFGRKYYKIDKLNDSGTCPENDNRQPCSKAEANLISSEGTLFEEDEFHYPVIDLDIPCRLIPSSTPGHFHLYIDHPVPQDKYLAMIQAMADAGVVQQFYAEAAKLRGATFVRPEWVKKP